MTSTQQITVSSRYYCHNGHKGLSDSDDGVVGALVTLELPEGSPVRDLPWIITIGPLSDEDEWEPVVVGPYERPHALALAESIVADEELMAVVEPLLPLPTVDAIRQEIEMARAAADDDGPYDDEPDDEADDGESDEPDAGPEERHVTPSAPPSEQEIRAGFVRIAATLTSQD